MPTPILTSNDMSSSNFSGPGRPPLPSPYPDMALGFTHSSFSYNDLAAATNDFSQANLLGQDGFEYVHKGVLPNGKEIALRSLKSGSGQGEREFRVEVGIISRVHHRHLVSLVGFCIAGGQRMLVYEFVPNNNLEFHLYGEGRPVMNWPTTCMKNTTLALFTGTLNLPTFCLITNLKPKWQILIWLSLLQTPILMCQLV